jgi:large subunit ribosomal protein L9
MDVILKKDVPNLGFKNDIVKVKNGYGRNFLIPQKIGVIATESAKKIHAENMKQRAHKEEKIKNEALEVAKKLEETPIKIGTKTSTTGKIFGAVTTVQIAEALVEQNVIVDRRNIKIIDESVKEVGIYTAVVKLHKEVSAEIKFEVFAE